MIATLSKIERYWCTLRYLRVVQVAGRLRPHIARPRQCLGPQPLRTPSGTWQPPASPRQSLTAPRAFLFLNQSGDLTGGWDDPRRDRLWRYNLHYFDDLNAGGASARVEWHRALMADWMAQNPPGRGTGWEPYPTARRLVNWIKWALAGNALPQACINSLAAQARWLRQRLEWHLLGNHLFADAKALVFAGLWFEGPEARAWLDEGCRILAREVPEQILPDGGQFELSPMYHALALEDMLDLVNVTKAYSDALSFDQSQQVEVWKSRIPSMLRWHLAMCHPDRQIAFFNDAAMEVAPSTDELVAYTSRLGFGLESARAPLTWLTDSGYARLSQSRAVLIVDMARVGPDYLPGHAHADTLSFEFSLDGQRVFVNSGTSVYGVSDERLRQRGTAAHNTVVVNGRNSSDVWSGFRVGQRACPGDRRVAQEGDVLVAEASHDGYRQLPGRPLHHRCWKLSPHELAVEDRITARVSSAEARYHLHPDIAIDQSTSNTGVCRLPDGRVMSWAAEGSMVRLEPATWHPEFGISLPTTCVAISLKEGCSKLALSWA